MADAFEVLGDRGPPLKDAIKKLLLRCCDDNYTPVTVVIGFVQFAASAAADALSPPDLEVLADELEGWARHLRELAQTKPVDNIQ